MKQQRGGRELFRGTFQWSSKRSFSKSCSFMSERFRLQGKASADGTRHYFEVQSHVLCKKVTKEAWSISPFSLGSKSFTRSEQTANLLYVKT
jgi:hypothetical protein